VVLEQQICELGHFAASVEGYPLSPALQQGLEHGTEGAPHLTVLGKRGAHLDVRQADPLFLPSLRQRIAEPVCAESSDVNEPLSGQALEGLIGKAHCNPGIRRDLALRQAPMISDRVENGEIPGRIRP